MCVCIDIQYEYMLSTGRCVAVNVIETVRTGEESLFCIYLL